MMTQDTDLRPCPFCGGPAELLWRGENAVAECIWCDSAIGAVVDRETAVEKWNRRASTNREPRESLDQTFAGLRVVIDPNMPPDTIKFVQPEKAGAPVAAALREARQKELNETASAAVRQYGRTGVITEDVENDRHASMLDLKSAVEQWDALAGETPPTDSAAALREALESLYSAVIEQNRRGAEWDPEVFDRLMPALAASKRALAGETP